MAVSSRQVDAPRVIEERLLFEACNYYGVTPDNIFTARRGYHSKVRRAVALVLTDQVGWTERRTAKFFQKHHSAISETLKEARSDLKTDPLFFGIVERLRQLVSPQ